jgi:hypothetical protein
VVAKTRGCSIRRSPAKVSVQYGRGFARATASAAAAPSSTHVFVKRSPSVMSACAAASSWSEPTSPRPSPRPASWSANCSHAAPTPRGAGTVATASRSTRPARPRTQPTLHDSVELDERQARDRRNRPGRRRTAVSPTREGFRRSLLGPARRARRHRRADLHRAARLVRRIAAWHSPGAWLGALKLHPNLADECRGIIKVPLFLAIMSVLAGYADHHNGRGISVAHSTVAKLVGHCPKTVQRACDAAGQLGALRLVLRGCDMTINQRGAVLEHYRDRANPRRRWRSLPNFYAATMPASLAALAPRRQPPTLPSPRGSLASTVEKPRRQQLAVHQPVGSRFSVRGSVALPERTTFSPSCGQRAAEHREQPVRTGAGRPITPQRQEPRFVSTAKLWSPLVAN